MWRCSKCGNRTEIILTGNHFKVLKKIVDDKLIDVMEINNTYFGYTKGKGSVDAIYIMRQIQGKKM